MSPKIFLLPLLLLSPVLAGPIMEKDSAADETRSGEVISIEDELLQLLELLRNIMKEGIPEVGLQPMEPLQLDTMRLDGYIEDTTLDITLRNTLIRNLSDFEVRNLSVTFSPKKQLKADVRFPVLAVTGWHDLVGIFFGEIRVDHAGPHRIFMTNVTVSANVVLCVKAGIPQIRDLVADFDVERISVFYGNLRENQGETEIPEKVVKDVLNRFRLRYLPLLLNTGKLYLNELVARLIEDPDEQGIPSIFLQVIQLLSAETEMMNFR